MHKQKVDVEKFFVDKVSSKSAKRPEDFDLYKQRYYDHHYTVTEIAKHNKVSRSTVFIIVVHLN